MEPGELVSAICSRAGVTPDQPVALAKLVAACLGPRALRIAEPATIHAHTKLVRLGDEWRIYVQRGLPPQMAAAGVVRRLVEWELTQRAYDGAHRSALVEAAGERLEVLVAPASGERGSRGHNAGGGPRKTRGGKSPPRARRAG